MAGLVAIDLAAGRSFVETLQRVWDSGDAAFPLDQRLAGPARTSVLEAIRPTRLIDGTGAHRCDGGAEVEAGDAVVITTSGTTGRPKGVVLTHDALVASANATSTALGVDPSEHHWLSCLPLSHVGGLSVVVRALVTATPLTVLDGFERDAVLDAAGPSVLVSLVPTTLRRVGAEHFRTVLLGGSAPPRDLAGNVVTTYGMTETGSGVVYDGWALPGVEIELRGGNREIHLRAPMLLRAYRDGSVPLDKDGWLATGDAGYLDGSGRLIVEGRLGDLIITGGENVWPAAIEEIIRTDPDVNEVAVAGRTDEEWGQRVVAWVVPVDPGRPPGLSQLRALVRDQLAAYAAPREVVVVEALPKTPIGKVRRDLLGRSSGTDGPGTAR